MLTTKQHGLTEVTSHVILAHCLDPEQVKNVRRDSVDDSLLQVKTKKIHLGNNAVCHMNLAPDSTLP